jgi:hypothetical protein
MTQGKEVAEVGRCVPLDRAGISRPDGDFHSIACRGPEW